MNKTFHALVSALAVAVSLFLIVLLSGTKREPATDQVAPASTSKAKESAIHALALDFVMGSPTAVSNALRAGEPPKGYGIVCDHNGHFAASYYGYAMDHSAFMVRTSRFEAVVAAWRTKEVLESPPTKAEIDLHRPDWHQCETNTITPEH